MQELQRILSKVTTLTFDCYGTLIDWDAGLWSSFQALLGDRVEGRRRELFDVYVQAEAQVEAGPYRKYREVLALSSERVAEHFGMRLDAGHREFLAQQLPAWRPFADTNEALMRLKKRFRLGVLSNIDRDLFAGTCKQFEAQFDFVVTAEDVGSYKPADGHFSRLLGGHVRTQEVIHLAQSPFHDGVPARRFGIAFVWINRYNETNQTVALPVGEFADLASFANAVGA